MKKTIKVNRTQLQKLIQEEVVRQKRIIDLKSKREEIIKQLNEMYETEGEVDEGILGKIGDFIGGNRESYRGKFIDWVKQMQQQFPQYNIQMPEGQDLENAIDAAYAAGDPRVIKRQDGTWAPTHRTVSGVGNAFDGSGTAE